MAPDDEKPTPTSPALDPKVKELLERDQGKSLEQIVDEKTAAELQRWFGMPSFEKLEDEGKAPPLTSPEDAADIERRAETLAAVSDWMLSGLDYRHHHAWDVIMFKPMLDVRVDPWMPIFSDSGLARVRANAEVRELERPPDIEEELKDQTPQALLRDLHRSEETFHKEFEIREDAAALAVDAVVEVRTAMATSWRLPNLGDPPGVALRKIFAQVREDLHVPWADIPTTVELPNRRVTD
jgi:hypothetical protein